MKRLLYTLVLAWAMLPLVMDSPWPWPDPYNRCGATPWEPPCPSKPDPGKKAPKLPPKK